ncbi:hypothetical protein KHA80_04245 [Anaerobacillus sp. HL2]|nr:hypothetical protein KHA80_04245 [Anaerobacillus sp. HL2]
MKEGKANLVNGEYQRMPEGMLFYQMRGQLQNSKKAKITGTNGPRPA